MSEGLNMELVSEALPEIDESELIFGNKLPPFWEGTYAVKSTLGKNGKVKNVKDGKVTYSVHAANVILKPLKVVDPAAPDKPSNKQKVFFDDNGQGRVIHDFFRISASNKMGLTKAIQFLKYAGDPEYSKYKDVESLATAVEDALRAEPDHIKLNGRWSAGVKVGVQDNGRDKYEYKRGIKNFPRRSDGSINHIVEIDGEQVPAQLEVVEYGEVTAKDVQGVSD